MPITQIALASTAVALYMSTGYLSASRFIHFVIMSSSVQAAHSSSPHQFHTINSHHYSKYQEVPKLTPETKSDNPMMNVHPLRQPPDTTLRKVSSESDITISCKDESDQMKILKDVVEKGISNESVTRPTSLRDETSIITQQESCGDDPVTTVISASNNTVQLSSSTKIPAPRAPSENHTDVDVHRTDSTSTIPSSIHAPMSSLSHTFHTCTDKEVPNVVSSSTGSSNATEPAATSQSTISPSTSTTQSVDDRSIPPTINVVGMKRKMPLGSNEVPSPTLSSSQSNTPMSRRDSLPLGLRNKKMKATDCLLFAATLLEQDVAEALGGVSATPSTSDSRSSHSNGSLQARSSAAKSFIPAAITSPVKKTKPLKKMVCEKIERSLREVALQNEQEQKRQDHQKEQERHEDNDCENNPKDADVLCGRGGKVNKHPGNIVYRKVVEYNKSYYQSVHKKHRILVSQSIVKAILNYGGRFMGQKGKEWTPICFKRAVQKTSQALRERSNTSDVPIQGVVGEYIDEK